MGPVRSVGEQDRRVDAQRGRVEGDAGLVGNVLTDVWDQAAR
jgi:hypothetical protein